MSVSNYPTSWPRYEGSGLDLTKSNGDDSWTLPIPATYVVGRDRKVIAAYVVMDYSKRLEPSEIVDALRTG
ncbi:MAG: alkyl hydroperoxide reductase [Alphaproteobacteria bacterium]